MGGARSGNRAAWLVLALPILTGIATVVMIAGHVSRTSVEFDARRWKELADPAAGRQTQERLWMLDSLLEQHPLLGLNRAEIEELLGPPSNDGGHFLVPYPTYLLGLDIDNQSVSLGVVYDEAETCVAYSTPTGLVGDLAILEHEPGEYPLTHAARAALGEALRELAPITDLDGARALLARISVAEVTREESSEGWRGVVPTRSVKTFLAEIRPALGEELQVEEVGMDDRRRAVIEIRRATGA